jgi:hypothetical protein
MEKLAREITSVVVMEFGAEEMLQKLSDPFWFQSFGCVLGFDWHSSGVTTTVCGALKEGLRGLEGELGFFVAGGKGRTSRKTPLEIERFGERFSIDPETLVYASRMSAKVDSSGLQDGYQLYHHAFFFTGEGSWTVVQQGMNDSNRKARRYHWFSKGIEDFVCEPHSAICSERRGEKVLDMVANESGESRKVTTKLSHEKPDQLAKELKKLKTLNLPFHHEVHLENIHPGRLEKIFLKTYERQPENFETLLGMEGIGPKTIRALSLIAELVYGVSPSHSDPARYSFAHGGKDGHPYPVDQKNYDRSIQILESAVRKARIGNREQMEALKRLESSRFHNGG